MKARKISERVQWLGAVDWNRRMRPLPERVVDAVSGEADPDRKIVKMLSARSTLGAQSAQIAVPAEETQAPDMRKPSAVH